MADEGISQLPSGTAAPTDAVPVVKAGTTTQVPAQSIADLRAIPTSFPISSVTLLQATLDSKAALVHTHAIESVTLLQTTLDGKAALVHTHAIDSVVLLQTTLDGKATVVHTHLVSSTTGLAASLDAKASNDHQHNASAVSSGTLATARLGSGTADATTFLRGDSTWQVPAGGPGGVDSETIVRLAADTATTTLTYVNALDLSFAMAASADYLVEGFLIFQTAAPTTGAGFGLKGPAAPTAVVYDWQTYQTAIAAVMRYGTAYDGVGSTPSASVVAANSNVLAALRGIVRNGVNVGSCTLVFRSEVNGSAVTLKAGSILRYRKLT